MRTITLELLRHGTAHNQLLSPLTPYLALCENHAAVTVHVPFEHNQFLYRLSSLDYKTKGEGEPRTFQLKDTARVLGDLLSGIPGLTAESNKGKVDEPLTHLRLIISASELALLPFELALSPEGLPGTGQYLLLQPQMPICLTREIHRVPEKTINWNRKPKILFIAASPPEVGAIPLKSHLLVLRRLIDPWIKFNENLDETQRKQFIEEHLHFIPNASIKAIEDECATGEYTHVHILAHGVEIAENYDKRFALALHNELDPNEVEHIDGVRLATALRASKRPDNESLAAPLVVTLASCHSGSGGTVAGAGSSIAHALHEAGIPMVVAGQFPLTFQGSIQILECLYDGFLRGCEPRTLLYDLRRRLYSQSQNNHDWASLVSYFSPFPDFESQLEEFRIEQAVRKMEVAFDFAEKVAWEFYKTKDGETKNPFAESSDEKKKTQTGGSKKPTGYITDALIEGGKRKFEAAKEELEKLLELLPSKELKIKKVLAKAEKREAEKLHATDRDGYQSLQLLRSSRDLYWDAFSLDRSRSGSLVQYLTLTLVLQKYRQDVFTQEILGTGDIIVPEKDLGSLWTMAHLLALYELNDKDAATRNWAKCNLIDLYLLLLIIDKNVALVEKLPPEKVEEWVQQNATEYAADLIDDAGRESEQVLVMRQHLLRYLVWFDKISDIEPLTRAAGELFLKLPAENNEML